MDDHHPNYYGPPRKVYGDDQHSNYTVPTQNRFQPLRDVDHYYDNHDHTNGEDQYT